MYLLLLYFYLLKIMVTPVFCSTFYVQSDCLILGDGLSDSSPLKNLNDAFNLLDPNANVIILKNSSKSYEIYGERTLLSDLIIKSENSEMKLVVLGSDFKMKINKKAVFCNIYMSAFDFPTIDFYFSLLRNSELIFQSVLISNLKENPNFKGFIYGSECSILLEKTIIKNLAFENKIEALISIDRASNFTILDCQISYISLKSSILLKITSFSTLFSLHNTTFEFLQLNLNSDRTQFGSIITINSRKLIISKSVFKIINSGFGSLFYTDDSSSFHELEIKDCIFKNNQGDDKALIHKSDDANFHLTVENSIFIDNDADSQWGGLFVSYQAKNQGYLKMNHIYCKGNFGELSDSEQIKSIFFNDVHIYNNNWRSNLIAPKGEQCIRIYGTENTTINGFFVIDTMSQKGVAGFKFHLFTSYYESENGKEFRDRVQKGETVSANFSNFFFINISSISGYFDRGSAFHYIIQGPLTTVFDSAVFTQLRDTGGSPCVDSWCENNPPPSLIFKNTIFFNNNRNYWGSNCIGANKLILFFFNCKFINNTPDTKYSLGTYGAISGNSINISLINSEAVDNNGFDSGFLYVTNTYWENAMINFHNSSFKRNSGIKGGVFQILNSNYRTIIIIRKNSFIKNSASTFGGVLFFNHNAKESTVNIESNFFYENQANKGGAIFFQHRNFEIILLNNIFEHNFVWNFGKLENLPYGAVLFFSDDSDSHASGKNNLYKSNNSTFKAGVLYLARGTYSEEQSTFEDNFAFDMSGVALVKNFGKMFLNSCKFLNSSSSMSGGILYISEKSEINIKNCTFFKAYASQRAGCFYLSDYQKFTIDDSFFIDNFANEGGVIYGDSVIEMLSIVNCSFKEMKVQKALIRMILSSKLYFEKISFVHSNCTFLSILDVKVISLKNSTFKNLICSGSSKGCIFDCEATKISVANSIFQRIFMGEVESLFLISFSKEIILFSSLFMLIQGKIKGSLLSGNSVVLNVSKCVINLVLYGIFYLYESTLMMSLTSFDNMGLLKNTTISSILNNFEDGSMIIMEKGFNSYINQSIFLGAEVELASYGGSVRLDQSEANQSFHILDSFFYSSQAREAGGTVYIYNMESIMKNSTFFRNKADIGGAIAFFTEKLNEDNTFVSNCFFLENQALTSGGAFYLDKKIPKILNNLFQNNFSPYGPDFASFPYSLRVKIYERNASIAKIDFLSYKNETVLYDSDNIQTDAYALNIEIISGRTFDFIIIVDILDSFHQKITSINEGYGKLISPNSHIKTSELNENIKKLHQELVNYDYDNKQVYLTGENEVPTVNGSFIFKNSKIIATPTTFIPLFISHDTLHPSSSNISLVNSNYEIINQKLGLLLIIKIKPCVPGEIYINLSNFCEPCPEGKYSFSPNEKSCRDCIEHAACPGRNVLELEQGFWRSSNNSHLIYQCFLNEGACRGGDTSSCEKGYEGPLCSLCKKSEMNSEVIYTKIGLNCVECMNPVLNGFILGILFISLIIIVIVIVKSSLNVSIENFICFPEDVSKNPSNSLYLKILVDHIQLLAITQNIPRKVPSYFKAVSSTQSNSIFFPSQIMSFDCFVNKSRNREESTLFIRTVLIALLPFGVVLSNAVFWTIKKGMSKNNDVFDKFVASLVVSMFFVHPIIINSMAKIFSCFQIDNDYYMVADMKLNCFNSDHHFYILAIVVPTFLIWGVLFPSFCCYRIYKKRKVLKTHHTLLKYGFLYNGYQSNVFYWGFVKIAQKTTIIILTNIPIELESQIMLILLILILNISSERFRKMYVHPSLNQIEFESYIVALISLLMSLYYIIGGEFVMEILVFLIILISNVAFLVYWVLSFWSQKNHLIKKLFSKSFTRFLAGNIKKPSIVKTNK